VRQKLWNVKYELLGSISWERKLIFELNINNEKIEKEYIIYTEYWDH